MRITEITLYRVDLPLADPFQHASSGLITSLEEVVAAVRLASGVVGYGEVRGNAPYVTGDTAGRVVDVARHLSRLIVGQSVEEPAPVLDRIQNAVVGNPGAKALLDIAIHDAVARARGVSVATLLGGKRRDRLPTDASVPLCSPERAAAQTREALAQGFRTIKVRVGFGLDVDEPRLYAVKEAIEGARLDERVNLAVDANGTWSPKQAVQALRRWESIGLDWVEQPTHPDDIDGLKFVRESVAVPVMADESARGPREVLRLIEARAVDLLHFKLLKAGGLAPLKQMMAIAETAGIPYMIGQMDEGMLATAAAVQAGAASGARYFEVHGYVRVATQPFRGLTVDRGALVVPAGPGLGVEVDESALEPVATVREGN